MIVPPLKAFFVFEDEESLHEIEVRVPLKPQAETQSALSLSWFQVTAAW